METTLAGVPFDIDVRRCEWTVLAGHRFGSALIRVPKGHLAYSRTYLYEGANIVIRHGLLGTWEGVLSEPSDPDEGGVVTVEARHVAAVLSIRIAPSTGTYEALTAGALAHMAAVQSVAGMGNPSLSLGAFVEAAPMIERYSFTGQFMDQLLADLMDRTGQEALVAGGALSWGPPVATRYATPLVSGSDIIVTPQMASGGQRLADVLAVGTGTTGGRYRARDGDAAASGWPAQEQILSSGSALTLAQRAEGRLAEAKRKRRRIVGRLAQTRWDLREGDVTTVIEAGSFSGRVAVGRVVRRTYEAPATVTAEIEVSEDAVPATVAAVADRPTPRVGAWLSLYRSLATVRRIGIGGL